MRRALAAVALGAFSTLGAGYAWADIARARYADPTPRYDHGILGDAIEHGTLELVLTDGRTLRFVLPESFVFEDTAPRLADLDGDGAPEVVVVETDIARGARLAIYDEGGRITATPAIGRTHRWLAPIGISDLDGDGRTEIAYIDRPHLARLLMVWRLIDGRLVKVAQTGGLTNHRIGESYITGGIADCDGPAMITVNADWSRVIATRFQGGRLTSKDLRPYTGKASADPARGCTP